MVLKLVGVPNFSHTQIAAVALLEKGVPFKLVTIDYTSGEHKSSRVLENQPFGQVPYIDDDGFILYECRAIARYIEEKYPNQGTRLIPREVNDKALFEQAASVEQNNFYPYAVAAVHENLIKRFFRNQEPDPVVFQSNIDTLSKTLDVYDKILSKQKYLAGDGITLADLFHLPYATLLAVAGSDIMTSKPNVARWYHDITSRPSWQAVKDGIKSTID